MSTTLNHCLIIVAAENQCWSLSSYFGNNIFFLLLISTKVTSRKILILFNWSFLLKMWDKIFNIVVCCLPPLYLAMKATCPLWQLLHTATETTLPHDRLRICSSSPSCTANPRIWNTATTVKNGMKKTKRRQRTKMNASRCMASPPIWHHWPPIPFLGPGNTFEATTA